MIGNIIDRRKRPYRWKKITAIVEHLSHDNSCEDADQYHSEKRFPDYDELAECSLYYATRWAEAFDEPVTLYLYDLGEGIT